MSRYAIGVSGKAVRRMEHVWQKQPREGRLETTTALGLSIHNALPRIQLTNKSQTGDQMGMDSETGQGYRDTGEGLEQC